MSSHPATSCSSAALPRTSPRGRRRLGLVTAVAALLLLTGCGATPASPGEPHVPVDTPALRALKQQAGIKPCPATSAPAAQGGLPDASLPCLGGGRAVDPARLRGPLVINLFAQWCHPCRKELPYYQAFSTKHAGKVSVLGVDWQDFQPELALRLAQQTGVTYPLVADQAEHLRAIGQVLPQVILVDAAGHVVHQEAVEIHSEAQLEQLVGKYL